MSASYKILTPGDLETRVPANQAFALDVLIGLSEIPKRLSSKYFYDARGSQLFQKIMALPEYYLTGCEYHIFQHHKAAFSPLLKGERFNLVELGAGDGMKTSLLIDYFLEQFLKYRYVPIDISESAMHTLTETMGEKFPSLQTEGLVAEYFEGLKWLSNFSDRRNLVLFLGSNLGNFSHPQAKVFLRSLWNTLNDGDYVVIGFDLKKDIDLMLRAYNDSQQVTARFNFNLLERINRELGGNFDIEKFRFYATYNVFSGAIESYLVSLTAQEVFVEQIGQTFSFTPWEPIHTEYSYKFLKSDIETLARETGYRIVEQLYDDQQFFADSIWQVEKLDSLH